MEFIKVNKEQYVKFLNNLPDGYVYIPNMMAERTDIKEKDIHGNRVGTRFMCMYDDEETYEVREDFMHLCE